MPRLRTRTRTKKRLLSIFILWHDYYLFLALLRALYFLDDLEPFYLSTFLMTYNLGCLGSFRLAGAFTLGRRAVDDFNLGTFDDGTSEQL
mmetsp:Transcript_20254/g.29833  ORF Transcript_20254/g.29833 Transcript_20254/m.29833 type:complete len:90 (-) Transcript_20254:48-317(-)